MVELASVGCACNGTADSGIGCACNGTADSGVGCACNGTADSGAMSFEGQHAQAENFKQTDMFFLCPWVGTARVGLGGGGGGVTSCTEVAWVGVTARSPGPTACAEVAWVGTAVAWIGTACSSALRPSVVELAIVGGSHAMADDQLFGIGIAGMEKDGGLLRFLTRTGPANLLMKQVMALISTVLFG